MIVEHTFITILEAEEAMQVALQLLAERGFSTAGIAATGAAGPGTRMELRRALHNPAKAKSMIEWSQEVRIEWDRGRVTIAASIQPRHEHLWYGNKVTSKREAKLQADLLTAISLCLEKVLTDPESAPHAAEELGEVESEVRLATQRRTGLTAGVVLVVIVFAVLLTVLISVLSQ